jgi:hypothetical protein
MVKLQLEAETIQTIKLLIAGRLTILIMREQEK